MGVHANVCVCVCLYVRTSPEMGRCINLNLFYSFNGILKYFLRFKWLACDKMRERDFFQKYTESNTSILIMYK